MKSKSFRIGASKFVNESQLNTADAYDLLFDKIHEFVYYPDGAAPWQLINGTWTGALGHLINGMQMDRKTFLVFLMDYFLQIPYSLHIFANVLSYHWAFH
jgi:hypothetical protein